MSPVAAVVRPPLVDPAEFPNCVALLAELRHRAAIGLPDPVGGIDHAASVAIETSARLIRLCLGLGWDAEVRGVMASFPEVVR